MNMKMGSGFAVAAFVSMIMAVVVLPAAAAPPPTVEFLGRHAGIQNLTRASNGASLFYFFFPSIERKENAPLLIWLQGGPGSSDEFGLLKLNGPVHLNDDGSLIWNEFTWNKEANVLYVDQPVGTGFSDVVDKKDMCRDQDCASNDLYEFLQAFLRKNPGLAKNGFYITGESFAGHYIPAFASRIQRGNKAKEGIHVNLKGLAIGNGCTNPGIQKAAAYNDYALQMGLINESIYQDIAKHLIPACLENLKECGSGGEENCKNAFDICNEILDHIVNISHVDRFDVREKCYGNCSDVDPALENYLNQALVKHSLRVDNRHFADLNGDVYDAMKFDGMHNHAFYVPPLLEDGIQLLIYAGEFDLACNWIGNLRWIEDLTWWGKEGFATAPNVSFVVDGVKAGELRSYGPLNFLKVLNAGHMVPKDEPKVALEMIQRWISKKLK